MRSGTTVFGDLLAKHPDITWLGEAFAERAYWPVRYLDGLGRSSPTRCFGLKIFSFQLCKKWQTPTEGYSECDIDRGRRILDELLTRKWKFILLRRAYHFAQCVSLTRAAQSGEWHRLEERGAADDRARLNLFRFELYLKHLQIFRKYEEELFSAIAKLELSYESDLLNPENHQATADKAFEHLRLPSIMVSSRYAKLAASRLDEQIENYDEVARIAERLGVRPSL